jgi:hypothetical protein
MEKEPITSSNEYIDKLTLELLLNKSHYSKYLSNTDPEKYEKYKEFKSALRHRSNDIIGITNQMIDNPKCDIHLDINEAFEQYARSILTYLEMKELENPEQYEKQNEEEDMMFGTMDPEPTSSKPQSSFWSKEKVYKQDASAFMSKRR